MKKNMGNADKGIRIIIALIMAVLYFTGTVGETLGLILLIVAVVFLLTSLINFCPLYALLGIKTTKK